MNLCTVINPASSSLFQFQSITRTKRWEQLLLGWNWNREMWNRHCYETDVAVFWTITQLFSPTVGHRRFWGTYFFYLETFFFFAYCIKVSSILRCCNTLFVALTRTCFERCLSVNRISRKVNALQTQLCDSTGVYAPSTQYITCIAENIPSPLRRRRPNQMQFYVWTFKIKVCRVGVKSLLPLFFFVSVFVPSVAFVFVFFFLVTLLLLFGGFLLLSPFIDVFISSVNLFLQFSLAFYFLHLE